jgi:hypothetical protein
MLANSRRGPRRGLLSILTVSVLALTGLVVIGTGASASSSPPPGPAPDGAAAPVPFTSVFQCFGLSRGDDPNAALYLGTENFGFDSLVARTSNMMCETAFKFTDPAVDVVKPQEGQVLQCWKTAKGEDPNDDVILATSNFGENKATVRGAVMLCENALNARPDRPGTAPYGSTALQTVWQCFRLEDTSPTPNLPVVVTTNNFGKDRGEIGRAVMMCEEARKVHLDAAGNVVSFGQATGQVVECRTFNTPEDHVTPVRLHTFNFGDDNAVVRLSQMVCERAQKTRLPVIAGVIGIP